VAKDQPKRLFGQISTLPFTDNKTDSGSRDASRFVLPFAENVKQDRQTIQGSSELPYKENISVENKDIKDTVILPFVENIKSDTVAIPNTVQLPFTENVSIQNKADEFKKNIEFTTLPLPENRAGADFGEPVWKKIDWGGINLRNTIDSGELSYAKNLSTDEYPYLTPRASRLVFEEDIDSPMGLFAIEEGLLWVGVHSFGGTEYNTLFFYKASNATTYKFKLKSEDTIRSMVDYNGKVLIFPDKVYLDYTNLPSDGSTLPNIGDGSDYDDPTKRPYPTYKPCPNIDYATVHNNRIFGVEGDNIYGNALGIYDNWIKFDETSMASWAADVASQGDFVGITMYADHVVFFKPNYIHEQWGNVPPFRIKDIFAVGTIDNRSIKEVDGVLFFCWKNGVYVYTGGKPKLISLNLNKQYKQARAGTDGRKYYLSMYDGSQWDLFVYDTEFRIWTREDNLNVIEFAYWNNYLYALTYDGKILKFNSGSETVSWEAITEYYAGDIINKYVHEIRLRFEIANGANLTISIQYDDGSFEMVKSYTGTASTAIQTLKCSIIPKQAYRYRIKFVGTGYAKIHAMEVLMSMGGD
jgi:hypothetical protein